MVLALIPLAAWLAGCSPAWNWREVPQGDAPLTALLPCKPDRGSRDVPMAGESVSLRMTGCEANGATFAISQMKLRPAAPASEALAQWRAATLANMRAGEVREQPFQLAGGLALPQSVRLTARGQRADGQAVSAQAVWFARSTPDGLWLFHAVIYADTVKPEVADAFFGGLKLLGAP